MCQPIKHTHTHTHTYIPPPPHAGVGLIITACVNFMASIKQEEYSIPKQKRFVSKVRVGAGPYVEVTVCVCVCVCVCVTHPLLQALYPHNMAIKHVVKRLHGPLMLHKILDGRNGISCVVKNGSIAVRCWTINVRNMKLCTRTIESFVPTSTLCATKVYSWERKHSNGVLKKYHGLE